MNSRRSFLRLLGFGAVAAPVVALIPQTKAAPLLDGGSHTHTVTPSDSAHTHTISGPYVTGPRYDYYIFEDGVWRFDKEFRLSDWRDWRQAWTKVSDDDSGRFWMLAA